MAILDGNLQFTGTAGLASAMTDTPTTGTQQSTNIINLANARDMGIGDDPALKLFIMVTTTFTVGSTMNVQLQGAPDSAGSPGSWTTMWDSGAIAEADLIAGRYIANIDMPRVYLPTGLGVSAAQALPQYLRLQYVTSGTHSTGKLIGFLVLDRLDQISYAPGVTVLN